MPSKTDSKRKGPSILVLSASLIAVLYGGVLVWLGLSDDRNAGRPVVELTLPPEPVPDTKATDAPLRDSTDGDLHTADVTPAPDAHNSAPDTDQTPGATPLPGGTETLSPEELTLLEAAKNIRDGSSDADKDASMGDVRIVGAETVTPRSNAPATSASGEVPPLKPVPDPALVAAGNQGPLPIVAADGRKAWQVYARPLPAGLGAGPRIALVVSGLGISDSATAHAIKTLPPEVTLSFAPYGGNLQRWITKARAAGHEVLLELPMEPFGFPQNDPGPYTLLTSLSPADNVGRLEWLLSRFTGYVGVMNYQGARFTSEPGSLGPVLSAIKSRGLMYVDNGASNRSLAPKLANDTALPSALATRNIDPVQSPEIIANSFKALETAAKDDGSAVGVASGFPVTVDALSDWAATLKDKGVTLVPVSAMAR